MGVRFLKEGELAEHLAELTPRPAVVGLPGVRRMEGLLRLHDDGLFVEGRGPQVSFGATAQLFYSEPYARAFALSSVLRCDDAGLLLKTPTMVELASTRTHPRTACEGTVHLFGDTDGHRWNRKMKLLDCSPTGIAFAFMPEAIWLEVSTSYRGMLELEGHGPEWVEVEVCRITRLPDGRSLAGARLRKVSLRPAI